MQHFQLGNTETEKKHENFRGRQEKVARDVKQTKRTEI
jgi:hypothetical protein